MFFEIVYLLYLIDIRDLNRLKSSSARDWMGYYIYQGSEFTPPQGVKGLLSIPPSGHIKPMKRMLGQDSDLQTSYRFSWRIV